MAAGDLGRKVWRHDEDGDQLGWVLAYEAGRDSGDHYIGGFTSPEAHAHGQGEVFATWSVEGTEHGAFSFA